jgi:Predicted phosphoribosyltransferases
MGLQAANVARMSKLSMMNPNRYPDLRTAGRELAQSLIQYRDREEMVVLAIALAGVPVAHEVAQFLNRPLDLILIQRLLTGKGPGHHLCAVNVAGQTILDDGIVLATAPSTPQEIFLAEAIAAMGRREQLCRGGLKSLSLTGRTVLLVDCGIRTGSTMNAAARALRKTEAKSIIGAVPVTSREGYAEVAPGLDEFVCLQQPEQFVNAGYWYADFSRPGDDQVAQLLAEA